MPTEAELGWAAGIIDGEGCIRLSCSYRERRRHWYYSITVVVANTSLLMLTRLRDIFGVGRVRPRRKPSGLGKRPIWDWIVADRQAEGVLRVIVPHLVNKRREADVALLSRQFIGAYAGIPGRRGCMNPHREQLEWLSRQLHSLKRVPEVLPVGATLGKEGDDA